MFWSVFRILGICRMISWRTGWWVWDQICIGQRLIEETGWFRTILVQTPNIFIICGRSGREFWRFWRSVGGRGTPTTVKCKDCECVLKEMPDLPATTEWYATLRNEVGGRCPKCGRRLPEAGKLLKEMEVDVVGAKTWWSLVFELWSCNQKEELQDCLLSGRRGACLSKMRKLQYPPLRDWRVIGCPKCRLFQIVRSDQKSRKCVCGYTVKVDFRRIRVWYKSRVLKDVQYALQKLKLGKRT